MAGKRSGPLVFGCELKGISTQKKLGEQDSTQVSVTVHLKASASDVDLNKIVRLQRAGVLECQLVPTQGELPGTGEEQE